MSDPKRRSSDPVPGTKAPVRTREVNDAFKVKERQAAPPPPPKQPGYEPGTLGKQRKAHTDEIIDKASGYKRGGLVKKRR